MIWRERRILLIVLGVLLLANLVFFFTYRVQYESRLSALADTRDETAARLKKVHEARVLTERQIAAYRQVQTDLAQIYDERWSTERLRLTKLITEVQRLAVASHLVPKTYGFTQSEAAKETRFSGVAPTSVGINFSVQGNYQEIRRLINLLELSDQFVIIDSLTLNSASPDGKTEQMSIRIKTLFHDEPAAPGPFVNQEM